MNQFMVLYHKLVYDTHCIAFVSFNYVCLRIFAILLL